MATELFVTKLQKYSSQEDISGMPKAHGFRKSFDSSLCCNKGMVRLKAFWRAKAQQWECSEPNSCTSFAFLQLIFIPSDSQL